MTGFLLLAIIVGVMAGWIYQDRRHRQGLERADEGEVEGHEAAHGEVDADRSASDPEPS